MKKWLLILAMMVSGCTGSTGLWQYKVPEHNVKPINVDTIPVWLHSDFSTAAQINILEALKEWNISFNGQYILQFKGYFSNLETGRLLYEKFGNANQGIIILNLPASHPLSLVKSGDGSLAVVPEIGDHVIIVIKDQVGYRNLKTIIMHEIGHLMGAEHINFSSLMYPYYGVKQYPCIDKVTMMQVAAHLKLNYKTLTYCMVPEFP